MPRHYTTRDFFRQMPNALLARFFQERGLLLDFDFAAMPDSKPDALFAAWLELPENQRHKLDGEFRDIFEMSCEKGFKAIIDEAEWQMQPTPETLTAFIDALSAQPSHYHRAMLTYLDHAECWRGATRFFHADTLPYWRKRKNMDHKPAAVDDASIRELADLIRHYFHRTEGRGNNCVVEPLKRGDLDYFFAYPEDYSQQSIEWIDGEFGRRPHNPAFEVVYVYSQKDGSLDLNFRGSHKAIEPLQGMFANAILKLDELPPDPKDQRVYDLNPLRRKSFHFSYGVGSGIEQVLVKKLRLSSRARKGDRITLEADALEDSDAIYTLLDKIGQSVPLHLFNITQVELAASIITKPDKPAKTVTIRITYPNSCSLKYDEVDLKLRDMLEASGIEPKEQFGQEQETADSDAA
ncbi:hypothetical protein [Methylomonas sp. UP202]|uniref:hypothetical protein n=1 Tax=Methylomonas sp. UP202 TaxID=3040943 RepID=UPI00247A739F|nr:hypothetical protein [Methylomonas sp. UP202]WGS83803.1 hypothetical protein QC632_12080 [Methylomonas sp. UP202]